MACRYREELVGKRFISVRSPVKLKIGKISEWEWRSGIVRALSSRDTSSLDLSVLIEFDDIDWTRREWVRIHDIFQLFLVEHTLVWAERPDPDKVKQSISWPGLSFRAVVDKVGLSACKRKPVEFLVDKFLGLVEEKEIQIFQEGDEIGHPTTRVRPEVRRSLKAWLDYQDGQKILLTTPTVLVGYRLEVYRAEGTTQWYTAVIHSYNHTSKTLSVTDDTVLEEHNEDPTLMQMHLIDDGVVDSILRGVEIGIAPRRRPRAVNKEKEQQNSTVKASTVGTTPTSTPSRAPVTRKPRTPQQQPPTASTPPTPTPPIVDQDKLQRSSERVTLRLRPQSRDRKRKADQESLPPSPSEEVKRQSVSTRKRTRSGDSSAKVPVAKTDSSPAPTPVISESTPLRVSPRNTPSKERTRDRNLQRTCREDQFRDRSSEKEENVDSPSRNSESDSSVGRTRFRSRQIRRDEKSSSPRSRSRDEKVDSPLSVSCERPGSVRSCNSRTPTPSESVIKSTSGNRKDRTDKSSSAKNETEAVNKNVKHKTEKASVSKKVISNSGDKQTDSIENNSDSNSAVEEKLREIKRALETKKLQDAKNDSSKTEKLNEACKTETVGNERRRRTRERKKEKETDSVNSKLCTDKPPVKEGVIKPSKERDKDNPQDTGDNMPYIKKKQSILTGNVPSGNPKNNRIASANIDLNQSVTDQIARAEKLSSLNCNKKSGSVSSALSSPVSDSNTDRSEFRDIRDNVFPTHPRDSDKPVTSVSTGQPSTNTNSSWSQDERSQSRNSEERCSSGFSDECRRPSSRVDDLRSSKNSPVASPLIIDKSESIQPYRDPELMSKNPVRSNVPNMHNPKSMYPSSHNAPATTRPASVGMPSATTSSSMSSSRTPVIPSVAYPSPLPLGHSLSGASLSSLLPPGLHQLDPATLAIHQQIAAAQQQHINAAFAQYSGSGYSNALSLSYPPRGNLNSAQLEHLWQQKYPSVPVPPPWLLAKHQDDLIQIRDVRLLREQEQLERERLERDRLERERDLRERECVERERKERERLERERQEKERQERERHEREKLEQERAERERLEHEKIEKERLERERRERERIERERIERSRILKESVDSHAAVDQHFSESLRLASQRAAQTGMWPQPSITLGTGKVKAEGQGRDLLGTFKSGEKSGEIKPEEKIKQEQLRENDYRYAEMMRRHQELLAAQQEEYIQQQKMMQQRHAEQLQKPDIKTDVKPDIKPGPYGAFPVKREGPPTTNGPVKQEGAATANFSLYGYQPEKYYQKFITSDQLQSYGLDKMKNEKMNMESKMGVRSQSPRKKDMSVPPPLIKDSKPQSSVIVENKIKEWLKSASPHAHQQYTSHMPMSGSPHHQQPKPAHTPERNQERPSSNTSSPGSSHNMNPASIAHHSHLAALKAAEAARQGVSRSQSPLHIATPHQLSAAVIHPMDYSRSPAGGKSRGSPASNSPHTSVTSPSVNVSGSFTPAIAQPPVSLPQSSVAFSYSLIQQGLVPNPIYTHSSTGKATDSQRTVSVTGTAQVPRAAHSPHPASRGNPNQPQQQQSAMSQAMKRKGPKEGSGRGKRQKGSDQGLPSPGSNSALNLSIPVTTPQILTNQSPYTTTSSSSVTAITSMAASTVTTSTTQSLPTPGMSQAMLNSRLGGYSGFMDSFKSFVENTVQNAFLSDPDFGKQKTKDGQPLQPTPQQLQQLQQQHLANQQHQQQQQQHNNNNRPKSSLERSCTPVISQQSVISNISDPGLTSNSGASNTNSGNMFNSVSSDNNGGMAYVDTINRVANGQVDTDSDTLSAPSPPPQLKLDSTQSPHKSAKHPNLKKAWLQRHSDEDKQESVKPFSGTPPPAVPLDIPLQECDLDNSDKSDKEKDVLKHCYVNCSYISPSKEGGSKSPISAIQTVVPNGENPGDDSTASTSEPETQQAADGSGASCKRAKPDKDKPVSNVNTKRIKTEAEEDSGSRSSTPTSINGQNKKTNKRTKETKAKTPEEFQTPEESASMDEEMGTNSSDIAVTKDKSKIDPFDYRSYESEDSKDCQSPATVKSEPDDPMDGDTTDSGRKSKDGRKKGKDKKEKKGKVKVKVESEDDEDDSFVPTVPQPILKETELKALQATSFAKPLVRTPIHVLKKTMEPFLQDGSCSEVTPKLMKCRECKMTPTQRGKTVPNIFCRFYAFRRLKYSQRGFVAIDGFSELSDADEDDIDPWIPRSPIMEPKIDVEIARFIIQRSGVKFCELVEQERAAQHQAGDDAKIAWKRAVTGVREMCDVCDTTLFNMHWVCHKCGFVVCLDCYTVKANEPDDVAAAKPELPVDSALEEDHRDWLTCSANRQAHEVDKLMLTQIIPSDALWEVGRLLHEVRDKWSIKYMCPCSPRQALKRNGIKTDIHDAMKKKLVNGIGSEDHMRSKTKNGNINKYHPDSTSPLSLLADVASDVEKTRDKDGGGGGGGGGKHGGKSYTPITEPVSPGGSEKKVPASCSTLRELLTKTGCKSKHNADSNKKKSKNTNALDDIIQKVVEKQVPKEKDSTSVNSSKQEPMKLMHYTPRSANSVLVRDVPIKIHNLTETSVLYPDVPHSWLCDGRLLRLHDSKHKGNLKIFMEQWRRGQPVLVSGVDKQMDISLWNPKYFSRQFGHLENDLVNCRSGCVVVGHPMRHFWEGFGTLEERLVDEEGTPMLLKLKDWPPGDDFSDLMPQNFSDLMQALPLPEYTRRDGRLNLASRLPEFLVRPDLGPKMYIAYGSAEYTKEGTTNLHLDVSDAANVMVYVGFLDRENSSHMENGDEALKAMDRARCDNITRRRVKEVREIPGALWHIFDAVDADKMRDFINKVAKERGEAVEDHHDPIHDQSCYLDEVLRDRLAREYGVLGYTILQCLGDTIFVPAGAPHQVRNLNNCIKVAEDFVSPEGLHHCFQMTQEFRHLSETHSNHEDKLQVKNIIYHAVKDAIAVLQDADPEDYD